MHGYVVSDLHLLANRSATDANLTTIRRALCNADFFVFNGDIFDFQWSCLSDHESSAGAARQWIDELVTAHPACTFHFTLGNHDCVPAYRKVLDELATERDNLHWHESFLRLGGNVFLHGDVGLRSMDAVQFAEHRRRWASKQRRPRALHPWYDLAVRTRFDRALQRIRFRRSTLSRHILGYLEQVATRELADVEAIYFGHTHLPFTDYKYGGVRFHNTGAGTRGGRFRMLPVSL